MEEVKDETAIDVWWKWIRTQTKQATIVRLPYNIIIGEGGREEVSHKFSGVGGDQGLLVEEAQAASLSFWLYFQYRQEGGLVGPFFHHPLYNSFL